MRKISLALIATLLFSHTALAAFSDVSEGHKNRVAIDYLEANDVIGGYPDGTFRPEGSINRAELMKILVEGLNISPDENSYRDCFPDVRDEWFARYVCYAQEQGWVDGYPDGTFKPANPVNNVEAIKMMLNARGFKIDSSYATKIFRDINTSQWYYPFLVTAEKYNLVDPLEPGNNYTRGEVSEVMFRAMAIDEVGATRYSEDVRDQVRIDGAEEASIESARMEDYSDVKREMYQGERPFAIFFHASWCPVCREIEADLNENMSSYPDGVLILKADYDKETKLREEFDVNYQYHFVVFDADGEVVFSNNLFSADEVIDKIEETL